MCIFNNERVYKRDQKSDLFYGGQHSLGSDQRSQNTYQLGKGSSPYRLSPGSQLAVKLKSARNKTRPNSVVIGSKIHSFAFNPQLSLCITNIELSQTLQEPFQTSLAELT
jgi:hypothetical protein